MGQELEEVISWLEASEQAGYQAGVLLLQKHCKNRALVTQLLKKDSPTHREKLRYELVKVSCEGRLQDVGEVMSHFEAMARQATGLVAEALPSAVEAPTAEVVPAEVQAQVDALTEQMGQLHSQRVQLSNGLATLDPAEGPRVVPEILRLQESYNTLAQQRRDLLEGKPVEAPAPQAAPLFDRAELLQRRNTLRANISKGKGKAAAAQTDAKRVEHQEKVAKWELELQTVDAQLALPQA